MNKKLTGCWVAIAFVTLATHGATAEPGNAGPATYEVKIAPQALGSALQDLARQSGIQIIFFSRVTEGLTAPALDGTYTFAEAMKTLLAGSDLTFREMSAQAVEVRVMSRAERRAAKATVVAVQSVDAAAEPMSEVIVRGTIEQLSLTRVATPIHELPQTVSVFTQEDIRQLNATDLQDVLDRAPGITVVQASTLTQLYFSRGFEINSFHVDGGAAVDPRIVTPNVTSPPSGANMPAPDLSEYDRVEILRGSDALFGGFGNPGGTVSLVRKRPQEQFAFNTSVLGGSWDQRRIELDVTGPLAHDGAFRGRAVAMYSDQNYFYDLAKRERSKIFGVLEYDFSPDATLTAGGSYETDDSRPFRNGMPSFFDGVTWKKADFKRSDSLNYEWNRFQTDTTQAYVQYRQRFENGWALRLNAAGWIAHEDGQVGDLGLAIYTETGELIDGGTANFTTHPNRHTQISFDATVTGTFSLLGLGADTALGGDIVRLKLESDNETYSILGPAINPYEYDPRQFPNPRETGMTPWIYRDGYSQLDKYGIYASLRVHFGEAWSGTAGARVSSNRYTVSTQGDSEILGPFDIVERAEESEVITPFVGVMFESSEHLSWYASYAQMYQNKHIPLFVLTELPDVGPVRGTNSELGVKGRWRNGAVNGSLAIYDVKQKNILIDDLVNLLEFLPSSRKSHGVDLELQGELTPGWKIGGGYTWNMNENEEGMPLSRSTPRHLLKLWTDKRLTGSLDRWTVGGSLHAQSAINDSDEVLCPRQLQGEYCEVSVIEEPAYVIVDLRGSFEFTPNWSLALSVNNVFDKVYNQTWANLFHSWYGEPRNFMLRLDGRL